MSVSDDELAIPNAVVRLLHRLAAPTYTFCAGCGYRLVKDEFAWFQPDPMYPWLCEACAIATFHDCDPESEEAAAATAAGIIRRIAPKEQNNE